MRKIPIFRKTKDDVFVKVGRVNEKFWTPQRLGHKEDRSSIVQEDYYEEEKKIYEYKAE